MTDQNLAPSQNRLRWQMEYDPLAAQLEVLKELTPNPEIESKIKEITERLEVLWGKHP